MPSSQSAASPNLGRSALVDPKESARAFLFMNAPRPTWLIWLSIVLLVAVVFVMARPKEGLVYLAPLPPEFSVEPRTLEQFRATKVKVATLPDSEFVFQRGAIIRPPKGKVTYQSLGLDLKGVKFYTVEYVEKRTGAKIEICGIIGRSTSVDRPFRYLASKRGLPEDLPLIYTTNGMLMIRSDDRTLQGSAWELFQ